MSRPAFRNEQGADLFAGLPRTKEEWAALPAAEVNRWLELLGHDARVLDFHRYVPDAMAMGDCRTCGHVADDPIHRPADLIEGSKP